MRVWVSKKDIEQGETRNHISCPVAKALHRKYLGSWISVGALYASVGSTRFTLSKRTRAFVQGLDLGRKVRPGYRYMTKEVT